MATAPCLARETLRKYLVGCTDDEQNRTIEEHLAYCQDCERTIVELEADPDTLVELLRGDAPSPPPDFINPASDHASVIERAIDALRTSPSLGGDFWLRTPPDVRRTSIFRDSQLAAAKRAFADDATKPEIVVWAALTIANFHPQLLNFAPQLERRIELLLKDSKRITALVSANSSHASLFFPKLPESFWVILTTQGPGAGPFASEMVEILDLIVQEKLIEELRPSLERIVTSLAHEDTATILWNYVVSNPRMRLEFSWPTLADAAAFLDERTVQYALIGGIAASVRHRVRG